jgi:SNF2 family DNA or RNA helicase
MSDINFVVTSYSVLRGDLARLEKPVWEYCVLDEGHLLKNPKTATAMAARKIRSRHRLVLTGTPVQNRVSELWATFDFLMPNFLGSHAYFSKVYAGPIGKGQQPCASPDLDQDQHGHVKAFTSTSPSFHFAPRKGTSAEGFTTKMYYRHSLHHDR